MGWGNEKWGERQWGQPSVDAEGPLIVPINPTVNQVVGVDHQIVVRLEDDVSVSNGFMVEVKRGGGWPWEAAFVHQESPEFKGGYNGPDSQLVNNGGVYTVTIDPSIPWPKGQTVQVRVTATDPSGNPPRT